MLKPMTVLELIKLFMKNDVSMDDIVMLSSDEEGNSYGDVQPQVSFDVLKDGRQVVILFPYGGEVYEEIFKEEDADYLAKY